MPGEAPSCRFSWTWLLRMPLPPRTGMLLDLAAKSCPSSVLRRLAWGTGERLWTLLTRSTQLPTPICRGTSPLLGVEAPLVKPLVKPLVVESSAAEAN